MPGVLSLLILRADLNPLSLKNPVWYFLGVFVILALGSGIFWFYKMRSEPTAELVFASGRPGGMYLRLARKIAEVAEAEHPGISIRVIESGGSRENAELLASGKADLALLQNDTPVPSSVSAIAPTHEEFLHIVVRQDSRIGGFDDFAGKRIATGSANSGAARITERLLDYLGLAESVSLVTVPSSEAKQLLLENEVDAIFMTYGFRAPAMLALMGEPQPLQILNPHRREVEALSGFVRQYPDIRPGTIPPRSYSGRPYVTVSTLAVETLFVASDSVSENVIESITQTVFKKRSHLVKEVPAASYLSESFSKEKISMPLHDGARRYYARSEPGFFVKYAEAMAFGLSALLAVYGLIATIRGWIHRYQKDRIDAYYLKLEQHLIDLRAEPAPVGKEREDIAASVRDIRHVAFQQLAQEKLVPDASFRILQHLLKECDEALKGR